MSAFNPWLGFPARNAIYLDRDFDRQRGNGQAAFGTFQTAYAAATALAASTAETVLLIVGEGTAAQFGNLILAADWDIRVVLVGVSKDVSRVGTITGTSATAGFAVVMSIVNITVGNITTSTTDLTGAFNSGVITISGNGRESCVVGALDSTAPATAGIGGGITLSDVTATSYASSSFVLSGNVILTNVTITSNVSSIVGPKAGDLTATNSTLPAIVTMDGTVTTGIITLNNCVSFIFNLGTVLGGIQDVFKARNSSIATINNANCNGSRNVKLWSCIMIAGGATWNIQQIEDATIIDGCILVASGAGSPCINNCTSTLGVSQILDSILIPSGAAVSIQGTAASILVDNMRVKNDVDTANVTPVGSYTINAAYASPF